jgi:pSer/pThr/pTyr-binding forkhead associated (FHA) protein
MPDPYFDFRTAPGAERQRFDLPEGATEIVIGRSSDCGWVISSGAVSRRHARLLRQGGELLIEDLGSSNGTFVNGERLKEPRVLRDQDSVQVGALEATYVIPLPDGDATIAIVPQPSAPRTPAEPQVAEPRPAGRGSTGTHTVASPPPPPPPTPAPAAPSAEPPSQPEATPTSTAAPPSAPPAPSVPAATAPPRVEPVTPSVGGEGGPNVVELALIAAGSFLLVFVVGALLIRFAF